MRFQAKHSDALSMPKKVKEKYERTQEKINEQSWTYSKTNRVTAHKGMGSGSPSPMARGIATDRYAGLSNQVRKLDLPNETPSSKGADPTKALRALLRNKPQDTTLPGATLIGQGSSLNSVQGNLQKDMSYNIQRKAIEKVHTTNENAHKKALKDLAQITLRKNLKEAPLGTGRGSPTSKLE